MEWRIDSMEEFFAIISRCWCSLIITKKPFTYDIKVKRDTPIFATSSGKIQKNVAVAWNSDDGLLVEQIYISLPNWLHQNMQVTALPTCLAKLNVEHWENQNLIKQHILLMFILNSEIKKENFLVHVLLSYCCTFLLGKFKDHLCLRKLE